MKVVLSNYNTLTNQAFGVHLIAQSMKVVLSSWNTLTNKILGVYPIGQ
jgi:hypothetical protein